MRILICTQTVDLDHPILGFFHQWILEFSKHCTSVEVICLKEGRHSLPENIHIHSLKKETGVSRFKYLYLFYKHLWNTRNQYDAVFIHMNQMYVLLGYPLWRFLNKPIGLWYMHKSVDWTLRVAEKLVDHIFTASKESFRLTSSKLYITGHGIDTERFAEQNAPAEKKYDLLTIGRMTGSKNLIFLVEVLAQLRNSGQDFTLTIIGGATTPNEEAYENKLKLLIKEKDLEKQVTLLGSIPNIELPEYIAAAKVFVHAAKNGSLDKTLLEPLAMSIPVVSCAEGATSLPLGDWHTSFSVPDFAACVEQVLQSENMDELNNLQVYVQREHSLGSLIPKIISKYS